MTRGGRMGGEKGRVRANNPWNTGWEVKEGEQLIEEQLPDLYKTVQWQSTGSFEDRCTQGTDNTCLSIGWVVWAGWNVIFWKCDYLGYWDQHQCWSGSGPACFYCPQKEVPALRVICYSLTPKPTSTKLVPVWEVWLQTVPGLRGEHCNPTSINRS